MKLAEKGGRISLNTSKRLYFFQGKEGINLRAGVQETAIIPDDIDNGMLDRINYAVKVEHLICGYAPEKPVENVKKADLSDIISKGRNKVIDFILDIRQDKLMKDSVKIARLEEMLELEDAGQKRVSVTKKINEVLSGLAGISPVEETDKEKVDIKLTS